MTIWQSILKVTFTMLSAILAIAITVLIQKMLVTRKNLYKILAKRKKIVYVILLLLFFSLPVAFSLPKGALLSPAILSAWVRELLVSIVIVVTFWATWVVLDDPIAVKRDVLTRLLRLLLKVWVKASSENIQTTTQTRSIARIFFAKEYDLLEDLIGDRLLRVSIVVCQLRIVSVKSGIRRYEMVCDAQDPFESEPAYIQHKGSGALKVLQKRYDNYNEGGEEDTLRDGLRV
jgi:hypothetical protein